MRSRSFIGSTLTAAVGVPAEQALLETDLARLRSEFLAFPGMCLTVEQVARLLDVPREGAAHVLSALEAEGLLLRWANTYRRASPLLS